MPLKLTGPRPLLASRKQALFALTDRIRPSRTPWLATGGFELHRGIVVGRERWLACLKVHILAEPVRGFAVPPRGRARLATYLVATATIWPPGKRVRSTDRRTQRAITEALAVAGYRGEWRRWPGSRRPWGNFEKPLGSVTQTLREMEWFELAEVLPAAAEDHDGVRTKRRGRRSRGATSRGGRRATAR